MIVLGLTGSIGMGKTTTARFFADMGVPVLDSDAVVHALYEREAVAQIDQAFPGTNIGGHVDRAELSRRVLDNPAALRKLETIVHPLVKQAQGRFLAEAERAGAPVAVLDIPLLFETGADANVDAVVVVTAPAEVQRARVMDRPTMTTAKLDVLLQRQVPDSDKRRRADFIVDTSRGFDSARAQVRAILEAVPAIRTDAARSRHA
jgi:dephospho-CoA kinase